MNSRIGLVLLARAPLPGKCKSRLAKEAGTEYAASLTEAMLWETISKFERLDFARRVIVATPGFATYVTEQNVAPHPSVWVIDESASDDFSQAIEYSFSGAISDCDYILMAVSDAPFFRGERLAGALQNLGSSNGSGFIAPSPDGGFSLLCVPATLDAAWCRDIQWGTSSVFEQTSAAIATQGVNIDRFDTVPDIDNSTDIVRLLNSHSGDIEVSEKLRLELAHCPGVIFQDDSQQAVLSSIACREDENLQAFSNDDVENAVREFLQTTVKAENLPNHMPECVVLLGQPGAGKTDLAKSELIRGIPNFSIDRFRVLHPSYEEIAVRRPYCVPHHTAKFAAEVWRRSVGIALAEGLSFTTEVTGRNPIATDMFVRRALSSGSRVRIILLRCPPLISWLSIFDRFMRGFEASGRILFVDPWVHFASFSVLRKTLGKLENRRKDLMFESVDRFSVMPERKVLVSVNRSVPLKELLFTDETQMNEGQIGDFLSVYRAVDFFFSSEISKHPIIGKAYDSFFANDEATPKFVRNLRMNK